MGCHEKVTLSNGGNMQQSTSLAKAAVSNQFQLKQQVPQCNIKIEPQTEL